MATLNQLRDTLRSAAELDQRGNCDVKIFFVWFSDPLVQIEHRSGSTIVNQLCSIGRYLRILFSRRQPSETRLNQQMGLKLLALDVHYTERWATAAGVLFDGWDADQPICEETVRLNEVAEYQSGEFFRRELPCLISVIERFEYLPETFLIDGYVWLDSLKSPGLGAHLFDAFDGRIPVVGIAKTRFHTARAVEIIRGTSHAPLFVSAVGMDVEGAAESVRKMVGPYRIPDLLKRADQLSRGNLHPGSD